ncbi:xanthine/uracil permease [Candidimonas sp. SYP-B2681]|uniref:solute carrier family 23 protein n=1 Tax=Candidimonas sp. SYP-B2681 TaxID=2497686 RepID=UPI000F885779|nr:solute carrier family 23 protein [Candidimonas sp. SYP-B2681]RTZ44577.1 xanthine/uracil permease [Candidimonas sp. SYP-B2681]
MRKPESIAFWLNDKLPVPTALGLVLQQIAFLCALLVVPNLFVQDSSSHLGTGSYLDIASASLIASALSILLQTMNRWGIGSGYYYPLQATPTVFAVMFLASSSSGGMPVAYGMVCITGLTQLALSTCIVRLRSIFTVEIAGLAVMLTGVATGQVGLKLLFELKGGVGATNLELMVAAFTLFVMVFCNIWLKSRVRLFASLLGLLAGSALAAALGMLPLDSLSFIAATPWVRLPDFPAFGWAFDVSMVWPYVMMGLALSLMSIGTQTVAQRTADADWHKPDLHAYGRGLRAEGLTHVLASFINAMPQSASGGAVGLAATSGCASRYLGYWVAAFLLVTALCSKLIILWLAVPAPVIAALLLFLSAFLLMAGLKLVASRMLDDRRSLALGVGLIVGVSHHYIVAGLEYAPLAGFMSLAGVTNGTLAALLLTVLFRLGASRRTRQRFLIDATTADDLSLFMENQGRLWGARRDAVQRAEQAVWQAFDLLAHGRSISPDQHWLDVKTRFDEYALRVTFTYSGTALPVARSAAPSAEALMDDPEATAHLTAYMLSRLAKRVHVRQRDAIAQLRLDFEA